MCLLIVCGVVCGGVFVCVMDVGVMLCVCMMFDVCECFGMFVGVVGDVCVDGMVCDGWDVVVDVVIFGVDCVEGMSLWEMVMMFVSVCVWVRVCGVDMV